MSSERLAVLLVLLLYATPRCDAVLDPIHTLLTDQHIDTIIVGAGLAGIRAAQILVGKGQNVVMFEARGRPGGRVYTAYVGGVPIDSGASVMYGDDSTMFEVNPYAHVRTQLIDMTSKTVFTADGTKLSAGQSAEIDTAYAGLLANIKVLQKTTNENIPLQPTVDSYVASTASTSTGLPTGFGQAEQIGFSVNVNIEQKYGSDAVGLSLLSYNLDSPSPGNTIIFTDGFTQLITALTSGKWGLDSLDIRYDHIVYKIQYDGDRVIVNAVSANGTVYVLYCNQVIITVPLGVLKANTIAFFPALTDYKYSAIARLGFAAEDRVMLRFPYVFWDSTTLLQQVPYSSGARQWTQFVNMNSLIGVPILVADVQGTFAIQVEGTLSANSAALIAQVMAVLRTMYGASVPDPLETYVTAWSSDPWTYGARTFIAAGSTPEDIAAIFSPVNHKLYWAGEHCSQTQFGTVQGAWNSGEKIANVILGGGEAAGRTLPMPFAVALVTLLALILVGHLPGTW